MWLPRRSKARLTSRAADVRSEGIAISRSTLPAALRAPLALAALTGALSCGGGDLTLPSEGRPAALAIVSGNQQSVTIGQAANDSLVVQVNDRFGSPVPGVTVAWTAVGGGSVEPESSLTGTDGRAATRRILGPDPGTYTTTAVAAGLESEPATFITIGVAAQLGFVVQPAAVASSGVALDPQPQLQLQDSQGNPLARAGVLVTVQIASGGGSLGGTTTVASDEQGRVVFTDLSISGTPGSRTLIFAAEAFASATSAPIIVDAGRPASIAGVAGDGQTATVGTAVPVAPSVVVRDASGTPIGGLAVNFSVKSGGGKVTGATAVTTGDGTATVGSWTLGTTAGANELEARISAPDVTGNPVVFTATAVAAELSPGETSVEADPASIPASDGASAATVTVTARDRFGNPIQGLSVALSATGGGGTLVQPSGPTGADGKATGRFSATVVGDHVISAQVQGTDIPDVAQVTVTAGAPSGSASSATVPFGTAGSRTVITIEVRDAFGNPVTDAAGKIDIQVTGANSAGGLEVKSEGGGIYTAGYTPRRSGIDQVSVFVDGSPVAGSPFTSEVVPGPADASQTTAQVPNGTIFTFINITVQAADALGNPLTHGGDRVDVQVGRSGQHLQVQDNGNGSYSARFFPIFPGAYQVYITLNGSPIKGSPYTSQVGVGGGSP